MAGTFSIPPEVFALTVEYAARSLRQHGFGTILLIDDSGRNQEPLASVAKKLKAEWSNASMMAAEGGDE